eukprot:scaffold116349_cov32-Tisochrysis_lutea.AAC.1
MCSGLSAPYVSLELWCHHRPAASTPHRLLPLPSLDVDVPTSPPFSAAPHRAWGRRVPFERIAGRCQCTLLG